MRHWQPSPFVRNSLSPDIPQTFIDEATQTFCEHQTVSGPGPNDVDVAWKIFINKSWREQQEHSYEHYLRSLGCKALTFLAEVQWGIDPANKTNEELVQRILSQQPGRTPTTYGGI